MSEAIWIFFLFQIRVSGIFMSQIWWKIIGMNIDSKTSRFCCTDRKLGLLGLMFFLHGCRSLITDKCVKLHSFKEALWDLFGVQYRSRWEATLPAHWYSGSHDWCSLIIPLDVLNYSLQVLCVGCAVGPRCLSGTGRQEDTSVSIKTIWLICFKWHQTCFDLKPRIQTVWELFKTSFSKISCGKWCMTIFVSCDVTTYYKRRKSSDSANKIPDAVRNLKAPYYSHFQMFILSSDSGGAAFCA